MNVKTLLVAAVVSAGGLLYAQAVDEEIELPDVTTVISGGAFTAGKDSVPDYKEILPETDSPKIQLPTMGKSKAEGISVKDRSESLSKEKDIYAEGELGAGYPFYFIGDFSVYRASGNSPFAINFSHESSEGFASEKAREGYFIRNTKVAGEKGYHNEKCDHNIFAEYKTSDDGLQLNSKQFTDMVKHNITGGFDSKWNFKNGMFLSYGFSGDWFSRYGQLSNENVFDGTSIPEKTFYSESSALTLLPVFSFGWSGNGFNAFFKSSYTGQFNLKQADNLVKAEGSSSSESSHRAQFTLGGGWKKDLLELSLDGSLVVGSAIGEKDVVPAFALGLNYSTDMIEGQFMTISLKGGLDSYQSKLSTLENLYKYSVLPCLPVETTDWFCDFGLDFPVNPMLEFNAGIGFKKTAFENGIWQADYGSSTLKHGLYKIFNVERTDFNTKLGASFDYNNVKFGAEWKSFWKDVPVLEEQQSILATISYQSESTKWNLGASTKVAMGDDVDACPDISGWAGVKLAPALSVAFRLNDTVKLFTRESRKYAHSAYIQKGGSAVLLVKFQF
ncbi:MAG: hypothetical protein KBT11_00980 [Treponema sp.]|nr:hypothetical protein [Candidatus Treponema equifaecale]